ncbi:NAD-dependent epimerase/dehydratase family protein [Epilithonimonas ginsengisoli]|uniref:NAD-dependent epimerase/dehydratase family protein n=1 Tax=Epilithonimonas ginsengisoli TaxID=1245592 RepID=A0ABU4JJH6_9FLAO|nr:MULTISPECIES: NAD-dependent epimerase/dehydratase family protein [Chryseobacterium group]MBV6880927.1 NAD-dependent epimerase/dehydratase family protein [Epilithonimonas sp. FP105]MDW8549817.1 NAD-dependent epimerase/dehydratase family protein [Epilithonimonas ginsengisoli]OAH66577.1 NAD-dependent epimerase [Chryseobacterium sp. FP211-J200]
MIIGRGLIASLFINDDRENIIFFASGVSNSLENRAEEFLREEHLIRKTLEENKEKIFVYFSTCSIYDSSKTGSDYVLHKLKMEQLIKNSCERYLILRVSNAVGSGGNPNLLMNYLIRSIKNKETINVHTKATRNLIDAEDIKKITFELLDGQTFNKIVNVAYTQNYAIIEILEIIERFYDTKLDLNLIKSGSGYDINVPDVEAYFVKNNLTNKDAYLCEILQKYYPF